MEVIKSKCHSKNIQYVNLNLPIPLKTSENIWFSARFEEGVKKKRGKKLINLVFLWTTVDIQN